MRQQTELAKTFAAFTKFQKHKERKRKEKPLFLLSLFPDVSNVGAGANGAPEASGVGLDRASCRRKRWKEGASASASDSAVVDDDVDVGVDVCCCGGGIVIFDVCCRLRRGTAPFPSSDRHWRTRSRKGRKLLRSRRLVFLRLNFEQEKEREGNKKNFETTRRHGRRLKKKEKNSTNKKNQPNRNPARAPTLARVLLLETPARALPHPHVRVPDERRRLREDGRSARGRRVGALPRRRRRSISNHLQHVLDPRQSRAKGVLCFGEAGQEEARDHVEEQEE